MNQPIDSALAAFPDDILLGIARNESASRDWRKAATKFLMRTGSPRASHPDLAWFVHEINQEAEAEKEVEAVVESATEEEFTVPELGMKIVKYNGCVEFRDLDETIPTKAVVFDDNDT